MAKVSGSPERPQLHRPVMAGRSAREILSGRVLVHTGHKDARDLLGLVGDRPSGVVVVATEKGDLSSVVNDCRRVLDAVLIDPAAYRQEHATPEAPFLMPDDGIFRFSLDQVLDGQLANGAHAALTPTGYIVHGRSDVLLAVVDAAQEINRDDAIVSVPLDARWLHPDAVDQLIAALGNIALPKAVFLGGQYDPLQRVRGAVTSLRRLVSEVSDLAIFRSDLATFDGLAYGALAGSIGTTGDLRHVLEPGHTPARAGSSTPDFSPNVLVGDLVTYVRGSKLARHFAHVAAPLCPCRHCRSTRRISTFTGRDDLRDAKLHSIATWSEWLPELVYHDTLSERRHYWRSLCRLAIENGFSRYNKMARIRDSDDAALVPGKPLRQWAGEEP